MMAPDQFRRSKSDGKFQMTALTAAQSQLGSWRGALLRYVQSGQPDLTNRQMALLLVAGQEPGPHTVRGLAARLAVSKPVVTRALNSLAALGLVERRRDERDRRSVFVDVTEDGETFLSDFAEMIVDDGSDNKVHDA